MKTRFAISMIVAFVLFGCEAGPTPSQLHSTPAISSTSLAVVQSNTTPSIPTEDSSSPANWEMAKSCITVTPARPQAVSAFWHSTRSLIK